MLSKARVGAADLFKADPGRLKCVRGKRDERGKGGSHIASRLSRALHSRGRAPVIELPRRPLVCRGGAGRRGRGGGGIEPRYQLDTTLESSIAKSEAMGSSHITTLLPSPHPRDALEAPRPTSHLQGRRVLGGCNASEVRGSKARKGALTSPQDSPGRSTPEAASRSDRFLTDTLWCGRTVQNRKQSNRSVTENRYQ